MTVAEMRTLRQQAEVAYSQAKTNGDEAEMKKQTELAQKYNLMLLRGWSAE